MTFSLFSNSVLFLLTIGIIGLIATRIIYQLTILIPSQLEKHWRIQSWQCIYPHYKIPPNFLKIQKTISLSSKHKIGLALLTPFLSIIIAYQFGPSCTTVANLILMWGLLLLASIDIKSYLLPDCLTLPLLWIGLCCNSFNLFIPLHEAVWGAILGYLSLWLVAVLFKLWRHKEGLGQGDVKLLAALGAWWGFHSLLFIVMMASLVGVLGGLLQIICTQQGLQKTIPFGPYLILAGLTVMFFNQQINNFLC